MADKTTPRYPFAPTSEDGAFLFVTDLGCYYKIILTNKHGNFIDNPVLHNNGESFELCIERNCDNTEDEVFDELVGNTILVILTSNIAAKGDVATFFYVCDINDGDGKARARKFSMWHKSIKSQIPSLEKHNFILPGFEGDEYDVSLLIYENHPDKDNYIKEFGRMLGQFDK